MSEGAESLDRFEKVQELVDSIRKQYPDAKKLSVEIRFEWVETEFYSDGAELCPVVKVYVER
jgi:hypothetical protein